MKELKPDEFFKSRWPTKQPIVHKKWEIMIHEARTYPPPHTHKTHFTTGNNHSELMIITIY